MRVNHSCFDILMPQKLLDGPDVVSIFEQVARKTVAKGVAACRFGDAGPPHSLVHRFLDHRLMHVVAMANTGHRIGVVRRRREMLLARNGSDDRREMPMCANLGAACYRDVGPGVIVPQQERRLIHVHHENFDITVAVKFAKSRATAGMGLIRTRIDRKAIRRSHKT
jgi:hypothetical protein